MKTTAFALALALAFGLSAAAYAQAPAKPAAAPVAKIDCTKVENKAHADCKAATAAPAKTDAGKK